MLCERGEIFLPVLVYAVLQADKLELFFYLFYSYNLQKVL